MAGMSCESTFQNQGTEQLKDLDPTVTVGDGVERKEAEEKQSVQEAV